MKNAKKSMFITTILMVAVLIVAVSTATFAWYTASTQGTATNAVISSASSGDANIAVDWSNSGHGTTIQFDTVSALQPMVPQAEYANGTTFANFIFDSANIDTTGKFGAVVHPTPWLVNKNAVGTEGDDGYEAAKDTFYVINHNVNSSVTVRMTASFTESDLDDMINIAVFLDGELAAIMNKDGVAYKVGPVEQDSNEADLDPSTAAAIAGGTGFTFELAQAGGYKAITIKAWLDGDMLTSPDAGKDAGFSFTFKAE